MNAIDRTQFVGGSDIAGICGIQPPRWRTAVQIWQRKLEPKEEENEQEKRKRFARGHVVEPLVANLLEALHGIKADVRNRRAVDPDVPYFAAELDAEIPFHAVAHLFGLEGVPDQVDASEIVNVEIKTVHPFGAKEWGEDLTEDVPVHYAAQVQWGLAVTRRRFALCATLFGADTLLLYPIVADVDVQATMIERAHHFWQECVLKRVPPAVQTKHDLALLYRAKPDQVVEANEEMMAFVTTLAGMRARSTSIDNAKDGMEICIGDYMKGATSLHFGGQEIATFKAQSRKTIDELLLKTKYPDAFKECQRTTEFRVLRLK